MIALISIDQYIYLPRDFPGHPEVRTSLSNTGCEGSIPGQGAKISYTLWQKKKNKNQNMKQRQYCNKFNKDFKKIILKYIFTSLCHDLFNL